MNAVPVSTRVPLAIANWKMAMTISESLHFLDEFTRLAGDYLTQVGVILLPPYTAIHALSQARQALHKPAWRLSIGAQDVSESAEIAHTGQISARLLSEAGCEWVMLGHWEVRRGRGEEEAHTNRKVHLSLEAGLRPLLLVGPSSADARPLDEALESQLRQVLDGCTPDQVARMAFVFEPEAAIGRDAPSDPQLAAEGCRAIRSWLAQRYGDPIASATPILYGGSVTPQHVGRLLACADIDGLGASRRGRDPASFAEIVRQIAQARLTASLNTRG